MQDDVRNGELADVVQLRRQPQLLELVRREAEPLAHPHGERRDIGHMGAELRLPLGKRAQQRLVRSPTADLRE